MDTPTNSASGGPDRPPMRRGEGDSSPTPREDDRLDALIRATELRDRIDAVRGGPLRARTREIHSYLIVAAAFALLGVGFGPPAFIVAAILLVLIIVPYTRRMGVRDRIRRLENELELLALHTGGDERDP